MEAGPHLCAVKSEPGSGAGSADEEEDDAPLISNVKTENASWDREKNMETVFRHLPVEFELKTEARGDFQTTKITMKEEHIASNSLGPEFPADVGVKKEDSGVPYSVINVSCSDVKQECFDYSRNAEKRTGSFRRRKDSVSKITSTPKTNPESEYNANNAAKERLTSPKFTTVKPFACSLCSFTCKQKGDLTRHTNSHTGQKPFSCPECTYTCNRKVHLRDHMLTHAGVKLFPCSHCNYSCNRKGQLTSHMLTHTGEKPFSCSLCAFTCKQKGTLTRHNKTHSGEKPFSCTECCYTCCRKGDLRTHMDRHAGNRLISCSHCSYTCYRKQDLRTHTITHTGIKPFACGLCDYKCCRKKGLMRHILTHTS